MFNFDVILIPEYFKAFENSAFDSIHQKRCLIDIIIDLVKAIHNHKHTTCFELMLSIEFQQTLLVLTCTDCKMIKFIDY
jgi:hypothetical protein